MATKAPMDGTNAEPGTLIWNLHSSFEMTLNEKILRIDAHCISMFFYSNSPDPVQSLRSFTSVDVL